MEGTPEQELFHEDISWSLDPKEVDYNSVLLESFSHPLKAKQRYWMNSYVVTARTQGKGILGRDGLRKTTLLSIVRVLMTLMNWRVLS